MCGRGWGEYVVCGRGWGECVVCVGGGGVSTCVGGDVRHIKSQACFNGCTMCSHDQCYNDVIMSVLGYTKSCLKHFMKKL